MIDLSLAIPLLIPFVTRFLPLDKTQAGEITWTLLALSRVYPAYKAYNRNNRVTLMINILFLIFTLGMATAIQTGHYKVT